MAGKKVQVPVLGGLRKVIQVTNPAAAMANPGTTITEFANQTVSLAQLKQALGLNTKTSTNTTGGSSAALVPGPGLAGGGVLVGPVPIYLTAPIPAFVFEDGGGGGGDGDPGPPGLNGATGAVGPTGPAVFFLPDDPEAALDAVPGAVGPPGGTGADGPAGPAIFMSADDGEDGWHAIPGDRGPQGPQGPIGAMVYLPPDEADHEPLLVAPPSPLRTVNKGANWASTVALVAAQANTVYVNCPVAGTILRARIVTSGGTGSCVVDVWKAPFGSFPPNSGNSITASAKPTISSGTTYVDSTLTGWTRSISAGDVLAFVLQSTSTFTQVQIVLEISQ